MHTALRPFSTAALALTGASVIAIAPVAAPLPDVQVPAISSASVQLAASTFIDPFTRWMQVFEATSTNLTEIGDYIEAQPERSLPGMLELFQAKLDGYGHELFGDLPLVAEGMQHWATVTFPAGMQTALELAASGQPQAAIQTVQNTVMSLLGISSPLMGLKGFLTVPPMVLQDIRDITYAITAPIQLLSSLVNPALNLAWSPLVSAGITAQKIVDAMEAGDALGALGAVINAPADAVDHFLNSTGGLVEVRRTGSTGQFINGGLLTQLLIKVPQSIVGALEPPLPAAAATSVADPSIAAGTMVSLDAGTPVDLSAGVSRPFESEQTPAESPATEPAPTEPASATQSTAAQATPAAEPSESASTPAVTDTVARETTEATTAEDAPSSEAKVSSTGATDLSAGNKAAPGKAGTTSLRPGQRLRTSMEDATDQVNKSVNGIRDGVQKSVSGLKDRISKAAPGKSGTDKAGKGPVSKAGKESAGKAGKSKGKTGAGNNKSGSDS